MNKPSNDRLLAEAFACMSDEQLRDEEYVLQTRGIIAGIVEVEHEKSVNTQN